MRWRVEYSAALALVVAVAMPVGVILAANHVSAEMRASGYWVDHSQEILKELDAFSAEISLERLGARQYATSGNSGDARQAAAAAAQAQRTLARLRQETRDNARQEQSLHRLDQTWRAQHTVVQQIIAAQPHDPAQARRLADSTPWLGMYRAARDASQAVMAAEKTILAQRRAELAVLQRRWREGFYLSLVVGVLMLIGGFVLLAFEIGKRRRAERQLKEGQERELQQQAFAIAVRERENANRVRANLLANVSHELRTPLNALLLSSELLARNGGSTLGADERELLEQIQQGGKHLTELIQDVLDWSRLQAGRLPLDPEAVALEDCCQEALGAVWPLAQQKRVELSCKTSAGLVVFADRLRVRQILVNLLGNAVRFTPAGGSVRVRALDQAEAVQVQVQDTGPGIAPERLSQIFERFEQSGGEGGAGLGLAIARQLVELQGGRIWVESEPGLGACFCFTLPRAAERHASSAGDLQAVHR